MSIRLQERESGPLRRLLACSVSTALMAASVAVSGSAEATSPRNPGALGTVFNCADSGTGTLREAVANAASGDTIDMSQLQCSSISLTTGAIVISQNSLTLIGPSAGLAVNGHTTQTYARVFTHSGTGTLTLRNISAQNGRTNDAHGGCVSSAGNVVLDHASVNHCANLFPNAGECPALGGGIYTHGDLTILDSSLTHNGITCYANNTKVKTYGGAAFANGNMTVRRSTIAYNYSGSGLLAGRTYGYGAGLSLRGNLIVADSTISGNQAGVTDCFYATFGIGGGIHVPGATSTVSITNSTISGNAATVVTGGIFTKGPLTLSNSTIAFNTGSAVSYNGHDYGPGLHVHNTSADLQSSIIANNVFYPCGASYLTDLTGLNATITGSNNLIMGSTVAPAGSLTADPKLDALASNGGPTATHKLQPSSPAINQGNNKAGLASDQRGPGYARVFGGVADIGAFETGDAILVAGFEPPG